VIRILRTERKQVQKRSKNILFLFFTIRHLTRRQIFYRLYYGIRSLLPHLSGKNFVIRKEISRSILSPSILRTWEHPPHEFSFLGMTLSSTDPASMDWYPASASKLWQYHFHSFDYLLSHEFLTDTEAAKKLVISWIARHNKPFPANGWAAFPLSLRLVNWIKWMRAVRCSDPVIIASISLQYSWLLQNVEYHVLGNHLLKNIKALLYCGVFFSGEENALGRALHLLDEEIDEQILNDGGHFELSPMYHAAVLEDMLDVYNLITNNKALFGKYRSLLQKVQRTISLMFEWLEDMSFGNTLSYFNDVSENEAPTLLELRSYAARLGIPTHSGTPGLLKVKEDSGYSVISLQPFRMIIDHGMIGPRYLPAHAHCDLFSFELAINGQRVICNSGTDDYGNTSTRQLLRSTQAHNTATIDGQEQAEMWGAFRVARRPGTIVFHCHETGDRINFEGRYDGYKHRKSFIEDYTRTIIVDKRSNQITVEDIYREEGLHTIRSYLHFHPCVEIKRRENAYSFSIPTAGINGTVEFRQGVRVETVRRPFFEEFGRMQQHDCLIVSQSAPPPNTVSYTLSIGQ